MKRSAMGVLPRRSGCCQYFADAHFLNSLMERFAVNAIGIMQEITRRAIPRKRFGNLLRGPFRSGMGGYVEVNGVTALVGHDNKDI
jgi:hypothetical protein